MTREQYNRLMRKMDHMQAKADRGELITADEVSMAISDLYLYGKYERPKSSLEVLV